MEDILVYSSVYGFTWTILQKDYVDNHMKVRKNVSHQNIEKNVSILF